MCAQAAEVIKRGDVVEMGDTLVLETSAFEHESSNLSIPTKRFKGDVAEWFKAPHC
jgi:hypothetical protein